MQTLAQPQWECVVNSGPFLEVTHTTIDRYDTNYKNYAALDIHMYTPSPVSMVHVCACVWGQQLVTSSTREHTQQ